MKKIIIILLCIISIFSLSGCKNKTKEKKMSEETEKMIKEIYVNHYNETNENNQIDTSSVVIKYYLGNYNGKECAYIKDDISSDNTKGRIMVYGVENETNSHPLFKHIPETISVYYENKYYTLKEAGKQKLFTFEELVELENYCYDSDVWIKL